MQSYENIVVIFYMLQIIIGVSGNFLLLCLYGFNLITSQRIRSIDLIFINLSFSHIMMILFKGVPFVIRVCIHTISFSDIECKIISYLQKVSRDLSLWTSCMLNVYQAIVISSRRSIIVVLKYRASEYIIISCVIMWVSNLLINMVMPLYVTGPRNTTNNHNWHLNHCSIDWHAITASKLVIWKTFYDAGFVLIMIMSSGYMVLVLYRHHQQVQHIHNTNLNSDFSPETRATKIILLLMSIFICFYSFSSIFIIVMDNSKATNQWLIHISALSHLCYPVVCPFILISSDSQILISCNAFKR